MKEIAVQKNIEALLPSPVRMKQMPEEPEKSFGDILKSSMGKVSQLGREANQAVQALTTGQKTDIHGTMIALEKASVSFQLMMEVRNKAIDAYKEVARMSV
ncbi:MAG: flagellar hook-basal body complex protein FliE [Deltaproteobacteria bacterium]|nr:flagellar hook-basal body complex protein FliE [Deltaproteobacteria bacterium]